MGSPEEIILRQRSALEEHRAKQMRKAFDAVRRKLQPKFYALAIRCAATTGHDWRKSVLSENGLIRCWYCGTYK